MGETIVTILAIIGLYTVLKKLGCASFIVALVIVIIAAALFFKYQNLILATHYSI